VARRFDQVYCGVDSQAEDGDYERLGGVFPIPAAKVGRIARLVGYDGKQKMSKSLDNAIYLSDSAKAIRKKVGQIYTGRQGMDEPGDVNNALFEYVRAFIRDEGRVAELERRYSEGDDIGDGHVKQEVAEAIDALTAPIREKRAQYDRPGGEGVIIDVIKRGTDRGNVVAEETLARAKKAMRIDFARRELRLV